MEEQKSRSYSFKRGLGPLTEQGVIVWNSGLTKNQIKDLEKVQKVALMIILGANFLEFLSSAQGEKNCAPTLL